MTSSLRSRFDQELARLGEQLLELGSRSRQMVADGLRSFLDCEPDLAREVVSADVEINRLRYEIEEQCYALLAMEQPVAGDLRTIVAALIIVNELERISDHGKKLARLCLHIADTPQQPIQRHDLARMGDLVLDMLDRVLRALVSRDVAEARAISLVDDQVDALYRQTFNVTLSYMLEDPRAIGPGTNHIQAAHEIERVGDRVTNVAERLVYAVTGELTDLNA